MQSIFWTGFGGVLGAIVGLGVGFWGPWTLSKAFDGAIAAWGWALVFITAPLGMALFSSIGGLLAKGWMNPALRTLWWKFSAVVFALGVAACLSLLLEYLEDRIQQSKPETFTSDPRLLQIFHDAELGADHLKSKYPDPTELGYQRATKNPGAYRPDVVNLAFTVKRMSVLKAVLAAGYPYKNEALVSATILESRQWKEGIEALLKNGAVLKSLPQSFYYRLLDEEAVYRLLIQYGARPLDLLVEGETWVKPRFYGEADRLEILMDTGSDLCVRDSQGKTMVAYLEEELAQLKKTKREYQKEYLPVVERAIARAKACSEFKLCPKLPE